MKPFVATTGPVKVEPFAPGRKIAVVWPSNRRPPSVSPSASAGSRSNFCLHSTDELSLGPFSHSEKSIQSPPLPT